MRNSRKVRNLPYTKTLRAIVFFGIALVSFQKKAAKQKFSGPFLIFTEAQADPGKCSLPTKKELDSRHLCLHTTDQSYAQDLQHFILLRDKLVTHVVMHTTTDFNLQCNNVATQVKRKCSRITGPFKLSSC